MATQWISPTKGIRYREHETRKHGIRRDRYYVIRYTIKGKTGEASQTITESIGWSSEGIKQEDCERLLLTLRDNHRTGKGPQTLKAMRQAEIDKAEEEARQRQKEEASTLQGIFEGGYMAAQHDKSESSLAAERRIMRNQIMPFFDNVPLREITPVMMDTFVNKLKREKSKRTGKPLAARTIQYTLAVIRQIWNYALSRGLTDKPYPAKRVKAPTADNRRTSFLSREEAESLLEALQARSPEMHDMSLISLFCGLRAGEIFKLSWADVNFQEGFVHVRDRKNKESGTAWMTPRVKEMLERRFAERVSTDFVFPSADGKMRNDISRLFCKVVAELGLNDGKTDQRDKIVFHTLRHTFASWLAQKGVPLHSLAGLMGHKTTAMTQRYAHLAPDVQKIHAMLIDDAPPQPAKILPYARAHEA